MKKRKKIKYANETIGRVKIVPDFLPSANKLKNFRKKPKKPLQK